MAPVRRKEPVVRRRRRTDDEGEEEGSQVGEIEDDSLSEGSASSNADEDVDADASDFSEEESSKRGQESKAEKSADTSHDETIAPTATKPTSAFPEAAVETKAMMNGVNLNNGAEQGQELNFDEAIPEPVAYAVVAEAKTNGAPQETFTERSHREREAYMKERRENPAFVPTRGGFFLHDNRANPAMNGFRPPFRGRGRARGQFGGPTYGRPANEPATLQWAHDLHETIAQPATFNNNLSYPAQKLSNPVATTSSQTPIRSFSTVSVLGNVPVVVYIAGMKERKPIQNIAKKQHTLLPNHRPPLRRDKPVRVSIPGASPRYVFPAIERSFIFIPRALRPNQQSYVRGRGRGSFHGSRRTSAYGSTYTPSVAMSRRSSVGRGFGGEDLQSPSGSVMSRTVGNLLDMSKPVVRLPPSAQAGTGVQQEYMQAPNAVPVPSVVMPPPPYITSQPQLIRENQPTTIPMHQPRPQKTVSVADIELPGAFTFNPPPQQTEQPFHQQVPTRVNGNMYAEDPNAYHPHSRHPSHPSQPSGTPLSQIPERAIHAQPFQPFPMSAPGYFAAPYPPGTVFYPGPNGEMAAYNPANAPNFVSQAASVPYMVPAPPAPTAPTVDPGTGQMVAHESNGMVYYYDSTQLPSAPNYTYPMPPSGGVVGMGGMMTPPGGFYYPTAPGGVYYAPQ